MAKRFQDVWIEQCTAARGIREAHGVVAALDYLVEEKLLRFAESAVEHPDFRSELPKFVAEVRNIFSGEELRAYCDHLERMEADDEEDAAPDDEDAFVETEEERDARRERRAWLKELLTVGTLGTG